MKIAVIIYSNDPETVWNAFRFASTSLAYDNEVAVFLLGVAGLLEGFPQLCVLAREVGLGRAV